MDRLFTFRHQASLTIWWNLSPLPIHGVESRCWRQLRDAFYVVGTCFTRTFPQLRSPPPSCLPREKWCTSQKQREVIFDLPRHSPTKVGGMTASSNSPPPGLEKLDLSLWLPCNKCNWTVQQWHFRKEASFAWLIQTVCLVLAVVSGFYWNLRPLRNSQPQKLVIGFWQGAIQWAIYCFRPL